MSSPGWWCAPQFAFGSTPWRHMCAGSDSSVPCLRAEVRAADARSQYTENRTVKPHSVQKRSRAEPSRCIAQTWLDHRSVKEVSVFDERRPVQAKKGPSDERP